MGGEVLEFEWETEYRMQICRAAEAFAPDYDEEKIYDVLGS